MKDLISRRDALDEFCSTCDRWDCDGKTCVRARWLRELPSAQPELDIWNDGTLHISVSKGQLDKIGRVLVEENGTIFCKLFYQDAEPERKTGRWIQLTCDSAEWWYCSECNRRVQMNPWAKYNYCPNCGIRIKRGE